MKVEESDSVQAARERMQANRGEAGKLPNIDAGGIRSTIIDLFGVILWIALFLGIAASLWQLVTVFGSGSIFGAISTFVSTVVTVGVGFVALDIRDRLIARS